MVGARWHLGERGSGSKGFEAQRRNMPVQNAIRPAYRGYLSALTPPIFVGGVISLMNIIHI
jgi:hypothetical protein